MDDPERVLDMLWRAVGEAAVAKRITPYSLDFLSTAATMAEAVYRERGHPDPARIAIEIRNRAYRACELAADAEGLSDEAEAQLLEVEALLDLAQPSDRPSLPVTE